MRTQVANKKEKGAALVEFALTVPVLVFLISGAIEFGNIMGQLTWLAQTGYHLSMVAAESPQQAASALVSSRFEQLRHVQQESPGRDRVQLVGIDAPSYNNNSAIRSASVRVHAKILPLSSVDFSLPVEIEILAPQLLLQADANSNFAEFAPPSPNFFGCSISNGEFGELEENEVNTLPCRTNCTRTAGVPGSESCI